MTHPADCTLCGYVSADHVYVDPATQARRSAAADKFNEILERARREVAEQAARDELTTPTTATRSPR